MSRFPYDTSLPVSLSVGLGGREFRSSLRIHVKTPPGRSPASLLFSLPKSLSPPSPFRLVSPVPR